MAKLKDIPAPICIGAPVLGNPVFECACGRTVVGRDTDDAYTVPIPGLQNAHTRARTLEGLRANLDEIERRLAQEGTASGEGT